MGRWSTNNGGVRRESVSVLRIMSADMLRNLPEGGIVIEDRAKGSKIEPIAVVLDYQEFIRLRTAYEDGHQEV